MRRLQRGSRVADRADESVKKVVRGGMVIFLGTLAGTILAFGGKVAITRLSSTEIFGVFSLCMGAAGLMSLVANFGLSIGLARYMAFFLGKGDTCSARAVMLRITRIGLVAAMIMCGIFHVLSENFGSRIFHGIPGIGFLLGIVSWVIPFSAFLDMVVGIGRGHGDGLPKVLFLDIARNLLFILVLWMYAASGLTETNVVWAYVLSGGMAAALAYGYAIRSYRYGIFTPAKESIPVGKIVSFSIPMAVLPIMWMVLTYIDTLMIGFFMQAVDVGLYGAASTVSRLFNPVITSAGFIFLPVATGLIAGGWHEESRKVYRIVTKWIFILSIPLAAVIISCPSEILGVVFGPEYGRGAYVLRILVVGFVVSAMFSMNTTMLTASGHSREQMVSAMVTIVVNLILCALLIPRFGIEGAAVSTAFSTAFYQILISWRLWRISRIHMCSRDFVKTILSSGVALLLVDGFWIWVAETWTDPWRRILVTGVLYGILFLVFLRIFGSFSVDDLLMVEMIEKRTGKKMTKIKALLVRHGLDSKSGNDKVNGLL